MRRKIPKIIHYCWFGDVPIPEETLEYIKTWKEKCPDYEFRKWDESNFDVDKYVYTKEAYVEKKWAFISDVCRLEKIYEFGGIYLDVNTKMLKNFDQLLDHEMFVGFEQDNMIQMGVFGAKKRHPMIKKLLSEYYKREHLLDENGVINFRTINDRAQEELLKLEMKPENSFQQLRNITVYPKEYFCPRYWNSSKQDPITDNTHTIHYFGASWHDEEVRKRLKMQREDINQLVSVIVPVYNAEDYLSVCLQSILRQTYENIEVILVDDGSTDKSGQMCDAWAEKDKRIRVVHKKNEGLNYARKDGFENSSGDYVTFLDSDDLFHKDNIKSSLEVLRDNSADAVIYASKEFSDLDDENTILASDEEYETKILATKDQIIRYAFFGDGNLPGVQYMTVWGKLYSRKIVERVDWSAANYRVYEDSFWTPQALLESNKIVLMSSQLIYYRRNIAYGAAGNNLGNRLTGNSINGEAVGYIEYIERMQKFYRKLARTHGFKSKLDEQIYKQLFLDKTWRIDNLAKAGLLDSENNLKFALEVLPQYIEAKNKHINNLDARIDYLSQNIAALSRDLADANAKITNLENDNMQLNQKIVEFSGVKRSAKLFAGNLKRKAMRFKN